MLRRDLQSSLLAMSVAGALALGCTGVMSGPQGSSTGSPGTGGAGTGVSGGAGGAGMIAPAVTSSIGVMPVRRTTRRELTNTLRALFNDPALTLPTTFPADAAGSESGFAQAATNVSTVDAREFRGAAEPIAAKAIQNLERLTGCAGGNVTDACLATFVKSFARRAYRRPLSDAETSDFTKLYADARAAGSPASEAIGVLVESFLQSPHLMIKFELGSEHGELSGDAVSLTRYQLASRLAFFLTGSAPDDALNTDVDAGKFATVADVERVAARYLADQAQIAGAYEDFSVGWLELGRLSGLHKDATKYPSWDQQTNDDLRSAFSRFVTDVLVQGDGTFKSLLTAPVAFANARLAPLYGISQTGSDLARIQLDPTQRRGLLMQAPFLATTGAEGGSLPPRRGERIFKHLLCGALGAPPAVIPPLPPADASLKTTRQRFEKQHSQLACAKGCHALIDPVGFPFENFAGGGDFRTMDNGEPVDASGSLTTPKGVNVTYRNGIEFVTALADLPEVQACYATHWYRYALGRRELESEQSELDSVSKDFSANGTRIPDLLKAIATSRSFRFRAPVEGETL